MDLESEGSRFSGSPIRTWQNLAQEHEPGWHEERVPQIDGFQDFRFGSERIRGDVAAVGHNDHKYFPPRVVSGMSRSAGQYFELKSQFRREYIKRNSRFGAVWSVRTVDIFSV